MSAVSTFTSSYTHIVCWQCRKTLYCSAAEPWTPQREYGWCPHDDDPMAGAVWTSPPDSTHWHRCIHPSENGDEAR